MQGADESAQVEISDCVAQTVERGGGKRDL